MLALCALAALAVVAYGKDGDCARIRDGMQKVNTHLQRPYVPQCDEEGNYQKVQCTKYGCFCAEPTTGEKIRNYFSLPNESEGMNCMCAVAAHRTGYNFLPSLNYRCLPNGNYDKFQCKENLCFCADETGQQIGVAVQMDEMRNGGRSKLNC